MTISKSYSTRIDVRRELAACVSKMGGIVTDNALEGRPDNPTNADFVFAADKVVAELKCLEVDWAAELDAHARKCTLDWMRRGKLPAKSGTVNLPDLPPMLVREIVEPFRKRVKQNLIAKANRQIKRTRMDSGTPEAKGLLIVVNDGNLALAPDMMAHLVMPVLHSGQYSSINTVIYLSVNLPVVAQQPFGQALFWAAWSITGKASVSGEFIGRLSDAWMAHLSTVTAAAVLELETPVNGIDDLRFVGRSDKAA